LVFNLLKKLGKKMSIQLMISPRLQQLNLLAAAANRGFLRRVGYEAAPLARLNAGILDLCWGDKFSRFRIAGFVRFYKRGTPDILGLR
jgi:hypothetical protein